MLTIEPKPFTWEAGRLSKVFDDYVSVTGKISISDKLDLLVETLKAMPINGCITGSYWLPGFDPEEWGTTPDIDVFVYGENELVQAVTLAQYTLGMVPGKGTEHTRKQEEWKLHRLMETGLNKKIGITTYTFECEGVMLNITHKMKKVEGRWIPISSPTDVLESFDMTIVMQGYDIKTHTFFDMRTGDPMVANPNPLRNQDCVMWTVAKWVRQFDRVLKYYGRGFDTRPLAKFYVEMIDECIAAGCLFDSEESHDAFDSFSKEFLDKRATIIEWLAEHEED